MAQPADISKFPKISSLPGISLVNGVLTRTPNMASLNQGRRGPRGNPGSDGVTKTESTSNVVVYEVDSPSLMSVNIETIDL